MDSLPSSALAVGAVSKEHLTELHGKPLLLFIVGGVSILFRLRTVRRKGTLSLITIFADPPNLQVTHDPET